MIEADLLVVGGGMAGLTMAIAGARAGCSVALVDDQAVPATLAPTFDGRASAIAHASVHALKALGAFDPLAPHAQPILDIRVSDGRLGARPSGLFLHFDHRAVGDQPFGVMLENRAIRTGLHAVIAGLPQIRVLAPATVTATTRERHGVAARLADGTELAGRLLVACDGRASPLRQAAGIRTLGWAYPQHGIVTTVAHEAPHNGVAHEHFLPAGPFAILPLLGNRSSLVWTERAALVPSLMALDHADFDDELRRRFGRHLGDCHSVGPRFSYPLGFHLAHRFTAPRLALVGDAAHAIHPIAGQGLNLGLRDVAALAEAIVDCRRLGLDIGEGAVLERYERWRRLDSVVLGAVTDGLNRLFSNDLGPVRLARDLGLAAVDRLPAMKRFFIRHARGTVGKLPRLLEGRPL